MERRFICVGDCLQFGGSRTCKCGDADCSSIVFAADNKYSRLPFPWTPGLWTMGNYFFLNSFDFRSIHSVTQPPISCFPPYNISWKHSIRSLRQAVYGRGVSPDTQTRTQYRRLTSAHLQGIGGYWQVFCWCSTTVAAMIVGKHISDNMSLTLSSQARQRAEFPHSKTPRALVSPSRSRVPRSAWPLTRRGPGRCSTPTRCRWRPSSSLPSPRHGPKEHGPRGEGWRRSKENDREINSMSSCLSSHAGGW
jgi:hypothetical protein